MAISIIRGDERANLSEAQFRAWAEQGNLLATDLVLSTRGEWWPAAEFSDLQPYLPPPPPPPQEVDWVKTLLGGLAIAGGLVAVYKIGQAIADEDFGGRCFPQSFRLEKISEHLAEHGSYCPRCTSFVSIDELSVDHIIPYAKSGLTSRQNADVICRSCNSRKGAKSGLLDHIRGRSA